MSIIQTISVDGDESVMSKLIERLKNAYMGSNFSDDAHWSDDGKEFLEIVEEMRHEFPFLEKWILLHPEVRSVQVIFEQTLKAQEQWFEKWLGESDG